MVDNKQSPTPTATRNGASGDGADSLPSLEMIERMSLSEVRRQLEHLAQERLRAGIGPEATVRYHALCRREGELLRTTSNERL